MNWWDYTLIGISAVCTLVSVLGARKSSQYYKKSKNLTIYANTNSAFIESQNIISTLTEILKLGGVTKKRGVNYAKELALNGEEIKKSINRIRESLAVDDYKDIKSILDTHQPKLEEYIDSLITGSILVDERFVVNDDFQKCQQAFSNMQLLLKSKLENVSEKLK